MRTFFLDIEASSLMPGCFPIEVAWVDETGAGEAHLVRPAPRWHDWDIAAERAHGISRELLEREGRPVQEVARRVVDVLGGRGGRIYTDSPHFDTLWLRRLTDEADVAGLAGLRPVADAYSAACAPLFRGVPEEEGLGRDLELSMRRRRAAEIVELATAKEALRGRREHRALPDALSLWRTWADVRRLVEYELDLGA